jgi:hypothetical protein
VRLVSRVSAELDAPLEQVFDFATSCEAFPRFIRAYGPIPGVRRAEMVGGAALAAGAPRRVYLTDQAVVDEIVTAFDRPNRHAYRWKRPPGFLLSLLVRSAKAEWTFSRAGASTHIDWVYDLELTTPFILPIAQLLMWRFEQWMQKSMDMLPRALRD